MIEVYRTEGALMRAERVAADALPSDAVWIDLISPTKDEEHAVERLCGIEVPTREEMREIEVSSRLYSEDGGDFMTASVVFGLDSGRPAFAPVTFILVGSRLVTLRYSEPKSFTIFSTKLCREPGDGLLRKPAGSEGDQMAPAAPTKTVAPRPQGADSILIGLLETVIDRVADMMEAIAADLDGIATDIFNASGGDKPTANADFKTLLRPKRS